MIWYDMFWYDMIYYIKLGAKIYSYRKIIQYVPNEKLYLNCNKERITIQLEFWNNIFFTNLTGVNNYKKKQHEVHIEIKHQVYNVYLLTKL